MNRKKLVRFKEWKSTSQKGVKFKCAAIAPEMSLVATGDDNNQLTIWAFDQPYPVSCYGGFNSEVSCVEFSKDEKYLYASSSGGTIIVWDIQ